MVPLIVPIFFGAAIGAALAWFLLPIITAVIVVLCFVGCWYFHKDSFRHNGNEAAIIDGIFVLFLASVMIGAGVVYGIFLHPEIWGKIGSMLMSGIRSILR